jgi:hypothetical protein
MKNKSRKISDQTWATVKAEYATGKDTIGRIAHKNGISRKSIERRAKKEAWKYGVLSDEVAKAVENATIKTIIDNDIDIAVKVTIKYLEDAEEIRVLTMAILEGLQEELKKSGGAVSRAEAERILFCQRVNETTSKTINNVFTGAMKAMGLYKEVHDHRSSDGSMSPNVLSTLPESESAAIYQEMLEEIQREPHD